MEDGAAVLDVGEVAQPGLSDPLEPNGPQAVSLAAGSQLGAVNLVPVPEPSALILISLGLAALMLRRRCGANEVP